MHYGFFAAPGGIGELSYDLTLNGTTISPTYRYEARYAPSSLFPAVVGQNLPIIGAGSDPYLEKTPNGDLAVALLVSGSY